MIRIIKAAYHRPARQWVAIEFSYERPADQDQRVREAMVRASYKGWGRGGAQFVSDVSALPHTVAEQTALRRLEELPADRLPFLATDEERAAARRTYAYRHREADSYQELAEAAAAAGRVIRL